MAEQDSDICAKFYVEYNLTAELGYPGTLVPAEIVVNFSDFKPFPEITSELEQILRKGMDRRERSNVIKNMPYLSKPCTLLWTFVEDSIQEQINPYIWDLRYAKLKEYSDPKNVVFKRNLKRQPRMTSMVPEFPAEPNIEPESEREAYTAQMLRPVETKKNAWWIFSPKD